MRRLWLRLVLSFELTSVIAKVTWSRLRRGPKRPGWSWIDELVATGMKRMFALLSGWSWAAQRLAFDLISIPPFAVPGVRLAQTSLGGRPATWITPKALASDEPKTLLFFHGGAYLFGSVAEYVDVVARIAKAARVRAIAVDYRLAPEHPFPAAREDALAAYRALLESGVKPEQLVVAGDSAGGGLTAALLVALREQGLPQPKAGVLMVPWVDLGAKGGSLVSNEPYDVFSPALIDGWAKQVTQGAALDDPRISVVNADLRGLPPLLVQVGAVELILDQVKAFAARAQAAGVEVTLKVWDDCIHDWPMYAALLPRGQRAIDEIGAYIQARLAG